MRRVCFVILGVLLTCLAMDLHFQTRSRSEPRTVVLASFTYPKNRSSTSYKIPEWFYRQERAWKESHGKETLTHLIGKSIIILNSESVSQGEYDEAERLAQSEAISEAVRVHGKDSFQFMFATAVFIRLENSLLCFSKITTSPVTKTQPKNLAPTPSPHGL